MNKQELHVINSLACKPLELVAAITAILPEIIQAVNESAWIDANKLTPQYDTKVLVCFDDDREPELDYLITDEDENDVWANFDGDVTHWQPLPQPPKGVE